MTAPEPLFKDVSYYINDSIQLQLRQKLILLLNDHGAVECPGPNPDQSNHLGISSDRFDINSVTHFITNTADFAEADALLSPLAVGKGKGKQQDEQPVQDWCKVVTPLWITRSIDLQNHQDPTFYSPVKYKIFSGMCFCSSDLPEADNLAISAGVASLGGQWKRELTREVTHLFVVAPHGAKHSAAMKYGPELGMVVVLPHWFEECVKLAQLVPIDPYQFPDPPLLHADLTNTPPPFATRMADYFSSLPNPPKSTSLTPVTCTAATLGAYPFGPNSGLTGTRETEIYQKTATVQLDRSVLAPLPDTSRNDVDGGSGGGSAVAGSGASLGAWPSANRLATCVEQIFAGRSVYFASDLGLREGLEEAVKQRVVAGGGTCWSWSIDGRRESLGPGHSQWQRRKVAERALREADTVVTKTREGWEYWLAHDQNKMIGNLAWIYHVLAAGVLSSPLDRILHYPIPDTRGVPDFAPLVFTISNYAGSARDYVRTLIETLGGTFQGAMTKKTSYVVSASDFGAKVEHAKSWGIPLVTHLWLEACVVEWRLVPAASSQAFVAPVHPDVNFAAILGVADMPRGAVERWAGEAGNVEAREAALAPLDETDESKEVEDVEVGEEQGGEEEGEVQEDVEQEEPKTDDEPAQEAEDAEEEEEEEEAAPPAQPAIKPTSKSTKSAPLPAATKQTRTKSKVQAAPIEDKDDDNEPTTETATPAKPPAKRATRVKKAPSPSQSDSDSGSDSDSPLAPPVGSAGARIDASNILVGRTKRGVALAAEQKLHNQMADANRFAVEQRNKGSAKKRRRDSGSAHPPSSGGKQRKSMDVEGESGEEEDEVEVGKSKAKTKELVKAKPASKRAKVVKEEEEQEEEDVSMDDEEDKAPKKVAPKAKRGRAEQLKKEAATAKPTPDGQISSFDNPPHAKPPAVNKGPKTGPMRIMSTGLGLDAKHPDIKRLVKLSPGAAWTDNPSQVTHLVVKGMSRTEKFLCSLAAVPHIVTQKWIDDSLRQDKILPEAKYVLKDKAKETELGDTLVNILARAKRQKLFDGLTIYFTPNIEPAVKVLQKIATSGNAIITNLALAKVASTAHLREALVAKPPTAFVVSCTKDRALWETLAGKHKVPIYSVEAVLHSAMLQEVKFDREHRIDLQL